MLDLMYFLGRTLFMVVNVLLWAGLFIVWVLATAHVAQKYGWIG